MSDKYLQQKTKNILDLYWHYKKKEKEKEGREGNQINVNGRNKNKMKMHKNKYWRGKWYPVLKAIMRNF